MLKNVISNLPTTYQHCPNCKADTRHYINEDYMIPTCIECGYFNGYEVKKRYPNPTDNPANIYK